MDNRERRKISLDQLSITPKPDKEDDATTYLVATLDDEHVGTASVTASEEDGVMILDSLTVDTAFRKQGVARYMFRHVVGFVLEERGNRLDTEVNSEHMAGIILDAFPPFRVQAGIYDFLKDEPMGDDVEPEVAHASLIHQREKLQSGSPDAPLEHSFHFTVDLR